MFKLTFAPGGLTFAPGGLTFAHRGCTFFPFFRFLDLNCFYLFTRYDMVYLYAHF
jgi:hypothetical protein